MELDAEVTALAKPRPTFQEIPARPPKIQIDALMETDKYLTLRSHRNRANPRGRAFAGQMGRTSNIVSVSYGEAKRAGPVGITKKRRSKAARTKIVMKSVRTIKHDLDKKRAREGHEGSAMDLC